LFNGALVAQRKGHPVEGRQAQNELELFVERSRYAAEAKFDCTSLTPSISEGLSGEV